MGDWGDVLKVGDEAACEDCGKSFPVKQGWIDSEAQRLRSEGLWEVGDPAVRKDLPFPNISRWMLRRVRCPECGVEGGLTSQQRGIAELDAEAREVLLLVVHKFRESLSEGNQGAYCDGLSYDGLMALWGYRRGINLSTDEASIIMGALRSRIGADKIPHHGRVPVGGNVDWWSRPRDEA